jgi:hypothetical protein
MFGPSRIRGLRNRWREALLLFVLLGSPVKVVHAQITDQSVLLQRVQQLTDAMARTQAQLEESQRQLEESQRQLDEMRRQLQALQLPVTQHQQIPSPPSSATPDSATSSLIPAPPPAATATAIDDIRERQAIQESEIATHEQTKVESESKFPVKLTGLVLLNGFVNTNAVDKPATPTIALPGSGSTGASIRQTILGFDALGPHVFGARSYADLRVDFDGTTQSAATVGSYTGYYSDNGTFLRLRTAHAGLQWDHTEAYFSLDRPLFSPDTPTSLAAVAEPALAWSGNLWTWNPQVGVTQDFDLPSSHDLRFQAALIDVGDAPISLSGVSSPTAPTTFPTSAEQSRWPGLEARIAWLGSKQHEEGNHFGVGGYFAPHVLPSGHRFDAWAGTLDARLALPGRLELTGSFYRGLGLGGLGGGAYKDYGYRLDSVSSEYYFRALSDVGGWTQLKERFNEKLEFNAAFGLDTDFARELRRYAVPGGTVFQNLSRNQTYTGNFIFSPAAYLMFSLEYRNLESWPVRGSPYRTNIVGVAVGYKF